MNSNAYYHEGPARTPKGTLHFSRKRVCELITTTGNLILRDIFESAQSPLAHAVPVGEYPLVLSLVVLPDEDSPRVASAMIEFSSARAVRWKPAHRRSRGKWLHRSITDAMVAIDSWHLAILDVEAADALNASVNTKKNLLGEEHEANGGLWNAHSFPQTRANVVTCSTGMGSGAYPAYLGFDRDKQVCALVVDFELFDRPAAIAY